MEDFSNSIRKIRREKGINQAELAELCGVSQGTVSRWESGSIPEPTALMRLAELAGLTLQEFINTDLETASPRPSLSVKGEVAAGVWLEAWQWEPDDWQPYQGGAHISVNAEKRFGLIVVGESMNEVYPPGTILDCVEVNGSPEQLSSGRRVIVVRKRFDGTFEATVKEYRDADGKLWLIPRSHNPAFQSPIEIGAQESDVEEIAIVAIVCGSYQPE